MDCKNTKNDRTRFNCLSPSCQDGAKTEPQTEMSQNSQHSTCMYKYQLLSHDKSNTKFLILSRQYDINIRFIINSFLLSWCLCHPFIAFSLCLIVCPPKFRLSYEKCMFNITNNSSTIQLVLFFISSDMST